MAPAPKLLRSEAEKSAKDESSKKLPKLLRPEAEKWRLCQKLLQKHERMEFFFPSSHNFLSIIFHHILDVAARV
jgi:hypothetical protein